MTYYVTLLPSFLRPTWPVSWKCNTWHLYTFISISYIHINTAILIEMPSHVLTNMYSEICSGMCWHMLNIFIRFSGFRSSAGQDYNRFLWSRSSLVKDIDLRKEECWSEICDIWAFWNKISKVLMIYHCLSYYLLNSNVLGMFWVYAISTDTHTHTSLRGKEGRRDWTRRKTTDT